MLLSKMTYIAFQLHIHILSGTLVLLAPYCTSLTLLFFLVERGLLWLRNSSSSIKPGWMATVYSSEYHLHQPSFPLSKTPSALSQSHVSPCNSSKPSRPAMSAAIHVNRQQGRGLILVFRWDANINSAFFWKWKWQTYWRHVWLILTANLPSQRFITTSGFEVRRNFHFQHCLIDVPSQNVSYG